MANIPMDQRSLYPIWQLIRDIWVLLASYRRRFIFASIVRALGDIVWLYPAFAFASIITIVSQLKPGDSLEPLWPLLGLWFAALIFRSLSQFFSKYIGYQVAEQIAIDSGLKTASHLFRLDIAWHERENSGNKIKRINNASEAFNKILRLWFNCFIEIAINLIAINVIIARFDRWVLFLLVVFLVIYFVLAGVMKRRAGQASYLVNIQEEQVNGLLFEAINNIRTIKVMAMTLGVEAILQKGATILTQKIRTRIFWNQSRSSVLSFLATTFKIVIFGFIFLGISRGHYEIGFLILFNTYFNNLRESVDELANASQELETARLSIARMKEILNEPITIEAEQGKASFPQGWQKITLDRVSFSYGDHQVLEDISLEIRRGEKIGIVGLSGAGKSTLFKLLLKERENFSGKITFDDLSIDRISSKGYFKHVSVVLQDTEVFNFSLRDNITMTNAKQKNNQKLLQQAMKTAHISDFIDKLPQGLDTVIGEKGIKLSGGERQRLGIARAIFKEPQLLLLDEATSHLDLESEEKIRDSLNVFFKQVTAIVIAHRLTTIKAMDRIIVIEQGRVIESGTFDELQALRGRFFELWKKQEL